MKKTLLKAAVMLTTAAVSLNGCTTLRSGLRMADMPSAVTGPAPARPQEPAFRPRTILDRYKEKALRLYKAGSLDEARAACEQVLTLAPNDADTRDMLEAIQARQTPSEKGELFAESSKAAPAPVSKAAGVQITELKAGPEVKENPLTLESRAPAEPVAPPPAAAPAPAPAAPKPVPAKTPRSAAPRHETRIPDGVRERVDPLAQKTPLSRGNLKKAAELDTPAYARQAVENDFLFSELPPHITQRLYGEYLYDRSIEVFEQAVRRYPNSPRAPYAWLEIGKAHRKHKDYALALQAFQTVVDKYGSDPVAACTARYYIAQLNFLNKDYETAYSLLSTVLKTSAIPLPLIERAYLLRARTMEQMQAWPKSLNDYFAVIDVGQDPVRIQRAVTEVVRLQTRHGKNADAIAFLAAAKDKVPAAVQEAVVLQLADLYLKTGDTERCKQSLLAFLSGPGRTQARQAIYTLADCYYDFHDYENAYNTYTAALATYNNPERELSARARLGDCAVRLGFFKNAVEAFDAVIARQTFTDEWVASKFGRAKVYAEEKKTAEAVADLKDVITFAKDEAVIIAAYEQLGAILRAEGKFKDAQFLLDKAVSAYGTNARIGLVKISLAKTLWQAGKAPDALRLLETMAPSMAASLGTPEGQDFQETLAELYFENKQYDRSADAYQTLLASLKDADRIPGVLYSLGRCFELMGKREQAMTAYQNLIQQYPGTVPAEQAQWNIKNIEWQSQYAAGKEHP